MHPIQQEASHTLLRKILSRTFSSQVQTALAPLQALRIFFSLAIILYHAAFYLAASLSSGAPADALINDFSTVPSSIFQVVYFGFRYGVDVFLFISGFFLASKLGLALQNGIKPTFVFRYLLLRWLRLAPMYMIVSLIQRVEGNDLCPNWTEVLLVANIFSSAHDRCIIVGWSTIVDFQSHVVICLLALMAGNMRRMKGILMWCVALSSLGRVWYWYDAGFPAWPIMFTAQEAESRERLSFVHKLPLGPYDTSSGTGALRKAAHVSYYPLYFDIRYRLAPSMIGFLTWVSMVERSEFYLKVTRTPLLSAISAILVACFDFGIILNSHPDLQTFSMVASGFHEAFGSVIVVIGISMVVMISCSIEGYRICSKEKRSSSRVESKAMKGGLLLSGVLVRILYGIYLGHPILLRSLHWWGAEMNDDVFTPSQVLLRGSVLYMSTVMLSVVVCLFEQVFLEFRQWLAAKSRHMEPMSGKRK